jgi:hypothetical protein
MVSKNGTMTEAAEYIRELSDAELVTLAGSVATRTQAFLSQGVPLPVGQIENHHLLGLLECLIGPEESLTVREWHLTWVDRQLDAVEAQVRTRLLESGVFDAVQRNVDSANGAR